MSSTQIWWTLIKVAVIVGFILNFAGMLTWFDRRGGGLMQDRPGPNRAVIKIFGKEIRLAGLLHTAADGAKFFFKEDFMPPNADRLLFQLAPVLVMVPVMALVAVIPMADTICLPEVMRTVGEDHHTIWPAAARWGTCDARVSIDGAVAPLNVGILYVFALAGQGIVGAAIAGWSSDNKFSLMGALRAASQMVSYEVTLGLSLVGCFMLYDTLRLDEMITWQAENSFLGFLPAWGIFYQPLAFVLFFFASIAEYKRVPFDAPEGESEIVAGYFLEYSTGKWLMWMIGEFLEVAISSMLIAIIFFGGWDVPGLSRSGWEAFGYHFDLGGTNWEFLSTFANAHLTVTLVSIGAFLLKALLLGILSLQVRWTLPRFRYDQIMQLCWKLFLPLSLLNVFVTGILILLFQ